jgi:subtilisin family serine protease
VIAVLDSGVLPHRWLPAATDPPFLLDAEGMGWHSPIEPASPAHPPFPPGTHWGHGTFIAGLIRRAAPDAQVLSMRVMNGKGIVDDSAAVCALTWLRTAAVRPKIVLMAFGRQASADDPSLKELRCAVRKLTEQEVTVVASAGNNGSDQPVYPAAFATELGSKMVSVGAIATRDRRALYSNHGPWVTAAWLGTDIVSINPQTIRHAGDHQITSFALDNPAEPVAADSIAWWTGTSFAAAIAAGHLASEQPAGVPLPEAAAQP